MIIRNFDEPREEIEREIDRQNTKLERLKNAYLDGAFKLDEYKTRSKVIEETIDKLKDKIIKAEKTEIYSYSPKDILLSRDVAFFK